MPRRQALLASALALSSIPACSGDQRPSEALIGSWALTTASGGHTYQFEAGGEVSISENGYTLSGNYEADDRQISIDGVDADGLDVERSFTYFASDSAFVVDAALPDGEVDDPVGRWSGNTQASRGADLLLSIDWSYDLRADGTATHLASGEDGDSAYEGSWRAEGDEIVFSGESTDGGAEWTARLDAIDGAALGGLVLERTE